MNKYSKGAEEEKFHILETICLFKVVHSPSKNICFICFNESPSKLMKNVFFISP